MPGKILDSVFLSRVRTYFFPSSFLNEDDRIVASLLSQLGSATCVKRFVKFKIFVGYDSLNFHIFFICHQGPASCVKFSRNGEFFASGGTDEQVWMDSF